MEKNMMCKIGIVAGAALAVAHYFMTITVYFFSASLYEWINEIGDEAMYMYFWPQVVLTGFVLVAALSSDRSDSVFTITAITGVAYAVEIVILGSEFYEEVKSIAAPFLLCAIGVIVMVGCAFYLKKTAAETEASVSEPKATAAKPTTWVSPSDLEEKPAEQLRTEPTPIELVEKQPEPAYIEFLSGELAGAKLEIEEDIIIGKDAEICNLILTEPKCSRVHCQIKYNSEKEVFVVKDMSTNGVFVEGIGRLVKEFDTELPKGTVCSIADTKEIFMLY